jgi:hypothetical protein
MYKQNYTMIIMNKKLQKELWKLINDLGIDKCKELLNDFIMNDDLEFSFEDENSLLYLAFNGYLNKNENDDVDAIIAGFIQMNLNKGDKEFKSKSKKKDKMIEDLEKEFKKKFNIPDDKNISLVVKK